MTDIIASFGVPQWTWIIFHFVMLMAIASEHGKPKKGNYSFPMAFMSVVITAFILASGGFFK